MRCPAPPGSWPTGHCSGMRVRLPPTGLAGCHLHAQTLACETRRLCCSPSHHRPQRQQHSCAVATSGHERKRNPFLDIERDVLPDGKPNTPWRRLKLQVQQALSIQALIKIYVNNHHKGNVWRPVHSAGIIMRIGALQYYRILQNPVLDEHTSIKILELLNLLAPDLTQPKVLHVLDGSRLCQVIVVLSTLNPGPQADLIDPLIRELMREGAKKLPTTKPDLLAELAAALVRLSWWEKDLWLAIVAAVRAALMVQQQQEQQRLEWQQRQHQQQNAGAAAAPAEGAQQRQPQQRGGQSANKQQLVGESVLQLQPQPQQQQQQAAPEEPVDLQEAWQQQQWQDLGEDAYVLWEQQQWQQWQQQQGIADDPTWELQQPSESDLLPAQAQWQLWQQPELVSQAEFQWEEQQQEDEQQQWLEEPHWYEPTWQQQQQEGEEAWLDEPWQQREPQQEQQQQQQGLLEGETVEQLASVTSSSSSTGLFGPRWLSADFPKLAAALAEVAAKHDQDSSLKPVASAANFNGGSGLDLRASIEDVMQMLGSVAAGYLVLTTPTELANLAGAYAMLGLGHDQLLPGVSKALVNRVQGLTSSLSMYRPSQSQPQQQWGRRHGGGDRREATAAARGTTSEGDVAAVIRAADALCQLGYADLSLVEAVQALLLHSIRGGSSSSDLASAAAAAGVGSKQLVQLLQLLVESGSSSNASVAPLAKFVCAAVASSGLDALQPQQLAAAGAALVELRQQPDAAAAAAVVGAAATARAAECGPEVLAEVLWGCVTLGCYNELLAEVAVGAVEQQARHLQYVNTKSRSNKKRKAANAAGPTDLGQDIPTQHTAVLSPKCQAQLVWSLQQLDRQDLVDKALAAVHGEFAVGYNGPLEPGVPVF